jgi:uncharacterized protein
MNKTTVVIGASANPERYAYKATVSLKKHGNDVYPIGLSEGMIDGISILINRPQLTDIDTVTVYVGAKNQTTWTDYILSLKPKRIIFNPGAENAEFFTQARELGIECLEACTLVMLSVGNY